MTLMTPLIMLGLLGLSLPILAHLLNRHQPKVTKWAAMQFLSRSVQVRSRQLRLRDLLLLMIRCLALILLLLALARPFSDQAHNGVSALGEKRSGVVIAVDVSYSMAHETSGKSRFDHAMTKISHITETMLEGNPLTLVALGAEHRVLARGISYSPEHLETLLAKLEPRPESLNLDSVPTLLNELVSELDAPQKEIYFITDIQENAWRNGGDRLLNDFAKLATIANVTLVPILSDSQNLAVTDMRLISGVLRKGTVARYQATVHNFGNESATDVMLKAQVNNVTVDTKTIPLVKAGKAESVSVFIPFNNEGPSEVLVQIEQDSLPLDNTRRTVAVIRDSVSILCVEGTDQRASSYGGFASTALSLRQGNEADEDFKVTSIAWIDFPAQDLAKYDIIILADVPAITEDQARKLEKFVRGGKGLVWFAGDHIQISDWNTVSQRGETSLLPAKLIEPVSLDQVSSAGQPLNPDIPQHPVCTPLHSLTEDLFSEARIHKVLDVDPAPNSVSILNLAGTDHPLLIEQALGRGQVLMFTTSAEPSWNSMALTPIFPMLLQQIVTYLTAREFEQPRLVGDSLSLAYEDEPDASDAVFDSPSGETIIVPVKARGQHYIALLDHADEAGFYTARVSVQSPGMPIAVNVNTAESDVKNIALAEITTPLEKSGIQVTSSDDELVHAIDKARLPVAYWTTCLIGALILLLIEGLLATRKSTHASLVQKMEAAG